MDNSIVRIVYFYADDCEHCINTINEVLIPLQDEHGDRL